MPQPSVAITAPAVDRNVRLIRLAARASVAVAGLLIAAKLIAWTLTDSVGLLSTLIDSLLDIGASLLNLIAIRHALTPADEEHRFGHGKAEALAGLGQAAFVAGSAAFLLVQAGERLFRPRTLANIDVGIAVMVFSIIVTLALVMFQKYVARRTSSLAIGADSLHYETDVLANAGVIVSLILVGVVDRRPVAAHPDGSRVARCGSRQDSSHREIGSRGPRRSRPQDPLLGLACFHSASSRARWRHDVA
jgi:divalent metal cation (Fe/Co/Zn/Cd) transporter